MTAGGDTDNTLRGMWRDESKPLVRQEELPLDGDWKTYENREPGDGMLTALYLSVAVMWAFIIYKWFFMAPATPQETTTPPTVTQEVGKSYKNPNWFLEKMEGAGTQTPR